MPWPRGQLLPTPRPSGGRCVQTPTEDAPGQRPATPRECPGGQQQRGHEGCDELRPDRARAQGRDGRGAALLQCQPAHAKGQGEAPVALFRQRTNQWRPCRSAPELPSKQPWGDGGATIPTGRRQPGCLATRGSRLLALVASGGRGGRRRADASISPRRSFPGILSARACLLPGTRRCPHAVARRFCSVPLLVSRPVSKERWRMANHWCDGRQGRRPGREWCPEH